MESHATFGVQTAVPSWAADAAAPGAERVVRLLCELMLSPCACLGVQFQGLHGSRTLYDCLGTRCPGRAPPSPARRQPEPMNVRVQQGARAAAPRRARRGDGGPRAPISQAARNRIQPFRSSTFRETKSLVSGHRRVFKDVMQYRSLVFTTVRGGRASWGSCPKFYVSYHSRALGRATCSGAITSSNVASL